MANAESDALVNTLADRLAEVEVETLREVQAEEEAKAQVHTLAGNLTEWHGKTFDDFLSMVEGDAQWRH